MSESDVLQMLLKAIKKAGSQKEFADQHDISPQYVNDIVLGRRRPGNKVLQALGLERVVLYKKTGR